MWNFIKKNWFLLALVLVLCVSIGIPELGVLIGLNGLSSRIAVIVIFLFTGFTLPSEAIVTRLKNWRLHVFIQAFIFVVVPLVFVTTTAIFFSSNDAILPGLFALAVLPTTVSSCVVFTSTSKGNTVAALFNAALANILGVVLSPALLSLLLRDTDAGLPLSEFLDTLRSLSLNILVPLVLGNIARSRMRDLATKHKKVFGNINNGLILLIVFVTISRTAAGPDFRAAAPTMIGPFLYLAIIHIVLVALAFLGARLLRLEKADLIATIFVAPQKTLAMGAPLLTIYFAANPDLLGIALLPLLFYHPWQLIVAGFLKSFVQKGDES